MYNPNAPQPYPQQGASAQTEDPRRHVHDKADTCPECGADLASMEGNARYKHAIYHWGDAPLDNYPSTLEARTRKAQVLGVSIEQVTK